MIDLSSKTIKDVVMGEFNCAYAYEVAPIWWERYGLTSAPEPIGEIWSRKIALEFFGKFSEINLWVYSADQHDVLKGLFVEGQFTDIQRATFLKIESHWEKIKSQLSTAIVDYYHLCLKLIDYEEGEYLPVSDISELVHMIEEPQINIDWSEEAPEVFEFTIRCDWTLGESFRMKFENAVLVSTES